MSEIAPERPAVLLGLGQGAIVALVSNTLLSAAPQRLARGVGASRADDAA